MKLGIYTDLCTRGLYYLSLPVIQAARELGHRVQVFPRKGRPLEVRSKLLPPDFVEFDWIVAPEFVKYEQEKVSYEDCWQKFCDSVDRLLVFEDPMPTHGCAADFVVLGEMIDDSVGTLEKLREYETIISPTRETMRVMDGWQAGLNVRYVPWICEWDPVCSHGAGFLFNGGSGGIYSRRGGPAVCEAAMIVRLMHGNAFRFTYKTQVIGTTSPGSTVRRADHSQLLIGGDMSREELQALYMGHAVMLAPSRTEGCGMPFIEAQTLGIPVITTNAPPMNEYVKHRENGWLVSARPASRRGLMVEYDVDPMELAQVIDHLIRDPFELAAVREKTWNETRALEPRRSSWNDLWGMIWKGGFDAKGNGAEAPSTGKEEGPQGGEAGRLHLRDAASAGVDPLQTVQAQEKEVVGGNGPPPDKKMLTSRVVPLDSPSV
jgi:hypothetical protein